MVGSVSGSDQKVLIRPDPQHWWWFTFLNPFLKRRISDPEFLWIRIRNTPEAGSGTLHDCRLLHCNRCFLLDPGLDLFSSLRNQLLGLGKCVSVELETKLAKCKVILHFTIGYVSVQKQVRENKLSWRNNNWLPTVCVTKMPVKPWNHKKKLLRLLLDKITGPMFGGLGYFQGPFLAAGTKQNFWSAGSINQKF